VCLGLSRNGFTYFGSKRLEVESKEPSICMNLICQMAMVRPYRYVSNKIFCWQVDGSGITELPVKREVIRPGM